jgi:hypothetical protein
MNIYSTKAMLAAIKQKAPVTSFLRDRYFPTGAGDMFPTEEVLVEYKDATGNKLAPVVLPRKGNISVAREGYKTEKLTPPLVAPSRPLTIDDLNKKGFGEDLFSDRTPAERQAEILVQDLADFDEMITNREEFIAAQCIFNNGYILKQYADKYGTGEFEAFELKFYEDANSAIYTPSADWAKDTDIAKILGDLFLMTRMLTTKGNNASEVIVGSDVADVLMSNTSLKAAMDLNRYNIGEVAPVALPQGAARLGRLNVRGRMLDLITYDGTYKDEESGELKSYVPEKQICVTAPGAGRGLYGCVTQMEQADGNWHSYMGKRVPRYWADKDGRELTVSSRPLFVPRTKDAFITSTVIG